MRVGSRILVAIAVLAVAAATTVLGARSVMTHVSSRYEAVIARDREIREGDVRLQLVLFRAVAARHAYVLTGRESDRQAVIEGERQWDLAVAAQQLRVAHDPSLSLRLQAIADEVEAVERGPGAVELDLRTVSGGMPSTTNAAVVMHALNDGLDAALADLNQFDRTVESSELRDLTDARERVERARAAITAAVLGLAVVAILSALVLFRGLRAPLMELTSTAERIAEGRHQKIGWKRRDEIGDLGRAIERMSDALGERENALRRQAELLALDAKLGTMLSRTRDVRSVCEGALGILAEAFGACGGAIFVGDGSADGFAAEATYGATHEELVKGGVRRGEGILGRAISQKQTMMVTADADESPTISMATTVQRPALTIVVPIQQADTVLGVLELSCAKRPDAALLTHLTAYVDQLGVSLTTAIVARERDKLHDVLEAQYAEVRAREERLRSQSETLDAQARELSRKNKELELASQMKSQFIATMSHELRTPLNSILGFTDLLLQRSTTLSPDDRATLGEVRSAGRHLLTLINDILDLARIGAGRMALRRVAVPVASIAREVLEVLRPQAESKGLTLRLEGGANAVANADPSRLRQILLNLVGNAVKFTERGSVTVRPRVDGERVRVDVVDTGPGIAEKDRAKLFREFSQIESSGRRHEGSGLGLAIARELVLAHGGEIGIESNPDGGSVFWFALRRDEAPPDLAPSSGATFEIVTRPTAAADSAQSVPARSSAKSNGDGDGQATEASMANRRVLLVEDHPRNARLIEAVLADEHVAIEHANEGAAAVQRALADPPDVILLDLELPDIDGFEVARRLRSDARTADVPIVAVTARALPADEARARAIGCNDFITKPVDAAKLRSVLRALVRPSPTAPRVDKP